MITKATTMEIPGASEGWLGAAFAAIIYLIGLIWSAAFSVFSVREHGKRLDRLETKTEDHDTKLNEIMQDVRERLARIEGFLSKSARRSSQQ